MLVLLKRKCSVVPHLATSRLEDYHRCRGMTVGIRARLELVSKVSRDEVIVEAGTCR